jgi:hypothetical protein
LFDTKVTDACIPSLCAIPNLREVALTRTRVTAQGVERLRRAITGIEVIWSDEQQRSETRTTIRMREREQNPIEQ